MLMEQKFVFLSVPVRQVKPSTIIMREKAAMWVTQNKKERLFFVVDRTGDSGTLSRILDHLDFCHK